MTCAHGEWDSNCDICAKENELYREISALKAQRDEAVSIIARDIIETAPESLMDAVDAAAPDLRALVDAARERQGKNNG